MLVIKGKMGNFDSNKEKNGWNNKHGQKKVTQIKKNMFGIKTSHGGKKCLI